MNIRGDLEKMYIEAAIAHGMETEKGNYTEINKQYNRLTRVYRIIEKDKTQGEEMTYRLLEHSNDFVKTWAAAHALGLGVNIEKAIEVLEQISNTRGPVRIDAEMTLEVWREQGYVNF